MIAEKAYKLVVEGEGYRPGVYWPGNDASGVTWGVGYDAGGRTAAGVHDDWLEYARPEYVMRLAGCARFKGKDAARAVLGLKDVRIEEEGAYNQFNAVMIPRFEAETRSEFPGCEHLPPDAFGALFSLCYNRGARGTHEHRTAMLTVRAAVMVSLSDGAVTQAELEAIASAVEAQALLWVGKGLPGLIQRRKDEAALIRGALGA
jgi:GH24 family phage-related lysozyme (muramidase)